MTPANPMTRPGDVSHGYAAFAPLPSIPVSTTAFDPAWVTPAAPPQHSMFQSTPQNWSYMDQVTALEAESYMGQAPPYQNPYATHWSPPDPGYMTRPGVAQSPYASTQPSYRPQLVTAPPVPHNPYQTGQSASTYTTRPSEVSPATTSTSMSSTAASWSAMPPPEPTSELPHVCSTRGCGRAYKRKAELDRHNQEKHGPTSGRLLCPVKMCPRGIPGEGFDRMSHLTQHLRSGKHKMTAAQAKFMAREHNPRKGGRNA